MKATRLNMIMVVVGLVLLIVLLLPIHLLLGYLSGIVPLGLAIAIGLTVLAGTITILTPSLSNKLNKR